MSRFKIILIVLFLAAGAVAALVFGPSLRTPPFTVQAVRYDVDADGNVDLTRWDINGEMTLWEWDRDADGKPELIGYDAAPAPAPATGLVPTGSITAWDWGGDSVIDAGTVPPGAEQLLQREEVVAARADTSGSIALVGADIRAMVDRIKKGFDDFRLADLRMPIVGASLPDLDTLLPGATRPYRNGVHQGFDLHNGHIGVPTGYSAPVVAAKDGTVIRAMHDFREMSGPEYQQAIAASLAAGTTPPDILDKLRGRQVWIDHGYGIVTRYVHLSGIVPEIVEGKKVSAGDIIGFVGNSGTEASVNGSHAGAHLHFELRIDDRYFGEGMSPDEIRAEGNRILHIGNGGQ